MVRCLTLRRFSENKLREELPRPEFLAIGVCTGLLTASAVASCDDLQHFIPLAVETVRIAFRVGLLVSSRAREISGQPAHTSWSTIVSGLSSDDANARIREFTKSHVSFPGTLRPHTD